MLRCAVLAVAAAVALAAWAARSTDESHAAGSQSRSIRITSAAESSGVVTVRVRISGWKMYPSLVGKKPRPGGGHWRILVDGSANAISTSPTVGRTRRLADGMHSVVAELVNNDGTRLRPPARSRAVTVRVGEPAAVTTE
jgi:hypothetical protein